MWRWTSAYSISSAVSASAACSRAVAAFDAASRRASSSSRAGSRRLSSACTSASMSAAALVSCSIWWRSNATCCCSRPFSSSLACAASRAAVVAAVRLGQLEAQPLERRLELGQRRGGGRFAQPRILEPGARRFDGLAEQPVAAGELHLLPAPQLFPQPLVAAGLGRLPLQRAPLLLDLVDDVVDARQVLLRGFELQLGGAAAALVLGDAGRFLDQLTAIGRAGAENLADLALLDHGVGLHAQAGVHQQVLHVAEAAVLAVDQVFALA